jgi:acetyltransferase
MENMMVADVLENTKSSESSEGFATLMCAKSVAVIGASQGEDIQLKLTSRPLKFLKKFGFKGQIYAVNPKYAELDGVPCYPQVTDIPGEVDVAIVFLAKARILPAVEDCGKKGVKAVIIFSSGYGETGEQGTRDQTELVTLAHRYGMRIVGPNASAVVNVTNGVVLSFLTAFIESKFRQGNIAFASNSGALLSTAMKLLEERGAAFSLLVSNGNESDLSLSDFLSFAVDDDQTKVIAAFIEGIKDGPRFIASAKRAAEKGKAVVALKVGSSQRSGRVAASHTGAITGNDRAYAAAFRQLGVTRARDITELVDFAALFARYEKPPSPELTIISVGSGGAAEMMADLCDLHDVKLADFSPDVQAKLPEILTPFSILVNPIDIAGMTSDLNEEHLLFRRLMEFLIPQSSVGIFGLIVPFLPYMKQLSRHVVELSAMTAKPIVPILTGTDEDGECAEIFRSNGLPFFATADQGARGLKALQQRADFAARRGAGSQPTLRSVSEDRKTAARKTIERLRSDGHSTLTLFHAGPIMASYGLRLPEHGLARSTAEAESIAQKLGFPVVMKIESSKITHKTEMDGVRLGIESAAAAGQAYLELIDAGTAVVSTDAIGGILIQRMVRYHTEIILGASRDVGLGHVLLVGLGGVWVELMKDYALRLPPIDEEEAQEMLGEIKAAKLLRGYRGTPPSDMSALVETIVNFSALVNDLADLIEEMEINPIFVLESGQGVLVGDALIRLRSRSSE